MYNRKDSLIYNLRPNARSNRQPGAVSYEQEANLGHAVVIGGSVTGLTAARVLAGYFAKVTVIERDHLVEGPEYRKGLAQAYHAHTLLARGQALMNELFPCLVDELLANGAVAVDPRREIAFYYERNWRQLRNSQDRLSIYASRPLLDSILYRRVAAMEGVDFLYEREVTGLATDEAGQRVTGVRVRDRRAPFSGEEIIPANLVVDASGRNSRAPQWLRSLGYEAPSDTIVNSFTGYASRIYRRPENFDQPWKTLYIRPSAPGDRRGGIIIPLEDDRWHVTLVGVDKDYPSNDEASFMQFARSLPSEKLYEAIKDAEPLSKIHAYRRTESRRRHYESLPAYLEGLLVYGDAAYTLNPVYAMGMTASVLGSVALDQSLEAQVSRGYNDVDGLARDFQNRLSRALQRPWDLVASQDRRWASTEVIEESSFASETVHNARRPSLALQPV